MRWAVVTFLRSFLLVSLLTVFSEEHRHGLFWGHRRRQLPVHPVDCVWSTWYSWGPCTAPCGNSGLQTRTRFIAQHAANGGRECIGSSRESRPCNRFCNNGGTPAGAGCDCAPGYTGTCCSTPWQKEGTCSPADQGFFGHCPNTCQTNWDCPGNLLCCPQRCWTWTAVCKEPVKPATEAPTQTSAGNEENNSLEILKVVLPAVMGPISMIAVAVIVVRCRPNNAVADSSTTPNAAAGGSGTIAEDAGTIVGLAGLKNGDSPPPYTERASTGMPSVST
ncbi:uncharacterized protein LOC144875177 [Branchiostoma floridae x Branchiostoma japonicum]